MKEEDYEEGMGKLCKIPTNYLDHEITHPLSFSYNHHKLIHSYHGSDHQLIQSLYSKLYSLGSIKLCHFNDFSPSEEIKKMSDICVNLDNPLSRLDNRQRMCIRDVDGSGRIKIPCRSQLQALKRMGHLFRV